MSIKAFSKSNILNKIEENKLLLISWLVFIFFFGITQVFSQPYSPGTQLNPGCSPGSSNCTVVINLVKTGTTANDTGLLQAYDVDGGTYTTFATLTAANTPTFDLAAGTTKGGSSIGDVVGPSSATDNMIVRFNGTTGKIVDSDGVILVGDYGEISNVSDITFITSGVLKTNVANADKLVFQAYDVDGASYTTFGTLTAGNIPTFAISPTSLTIAGHIGTTYGSAPTLSSCGSSPSITGTDTAGKITIGGTGPNTSCTVTFNIAYTNAPACTLTGGNDGITIAAQTVVATLTITSSADMSGHTVMYHCIEL